MPSSAAAAVPLVVQLLSPISESEEATLLSSCTMARKESPCVPLSLAREESSLRASVEMTGPARVLIEITDSNPQQTLFVSRELTFEPYDGAIERARAIGLALGVLSSTLTHPNSSPLPDSEPDSEPTPNEDTVSESDSKKKVSRAQTEADKSPLPSYFVYAGLGAEVGPSWVAGGPSGSFAVAKLLSSSWGVALEGKGGFTRARESRPRLLHVDVLAGPLFYRTHARAFTWAILSGGITWTEARLPLAEDAHGAGSRFSPLVHWGAGLGWNLTDAFSLTFSPGLDVIFSPTEVYVDSTSVGSTGRVRLSAHLGLTWISF